MFKKNFLIACIVENIKMTKRKRNRNRIIKTK